MPISPVNAGSVTIAKIKTTDGMAMLPTNVSFANQVFPIFSARGCKACHSGKRHRSRFSAGSRSTAARTSSTASSRWRTRPVNTLMPEMSQLLTMPSREDPPDRHPNVTFTSASDPDYLKILVWIREGAKNN